MSIEEISFPSLSTSKYINGLNDCPRTREQILLNGYKIISIPQGNGAFRFGISPAGLVAGTPFILYDIVEDKANRRVSVCGFAEFRSLLQRWLFDIGEGFTINSSSLGILFLASHGSNISAKYDLTYASYFAGACPFGAVADWPRCCFLRTSRPRQQRLEFSATDPEDRRGSGLLEILNLLSMQGG